jgi:hypothetical protein
MAPILTFLYSKLGISFFLRNGVTPFGLHVLALVLCLCFALKALFFLVSPLCFSFSLLCDNLLCILVQDHFKQIYKAHFYIFLVYSLSLKSSSSVLHTPAKLPLPFCAICLKFPHLRTLHLSENLQNETVYF